MTTESDVPDPDIDWLLSYSGEYYKKVAEDTGKIRDRISYTSGLLIVPLISLLYFIYDKCQFSDLSGKQKLTISVPFLVSLAFLTFAAFKIFANLRKIHTYHYPPAPQAVIDYYQGSSAPLLETKNMILRAYAQATSKTKSQNDQRTAMILSAQKIAAYSIFPIALTAITAYVQQFDIPEKSKQVEITNLVSLVEAIKKIQLKEPPHEQPPTQPTIQQTTTVTCPNACTCTATNSPSRPTTGNRPRRLQGCSQ